MTLKELPLRTVAMSFALGLVTIASASLAGQNAGAAAGSPDSGKIPVTTASDAAKKEFLQGRELAEKLQAQDSIQHFDKAILLDPDFALAELSRANAGATPKEFFGHLQKAVALSQKRRGPAPADRVSGTSSSTPARDSSSWARRPQRSMPIADR